MRRLFRKLAQKVVPESQLSYSQFGEDLILAHFFYQIGVLKPTYLDIGANEPRFISNTYFFYLRGSKGVLVEPNPFLYKKLKSKRPEDIVLNIGVGFQDIADADFYIFPNYANGLSSFSEKDARYWENVGMKGLGKIPIEKVIKMRLLSINQILDKYFFQKSPNFISLDVEGLDLDILKSIDYDRFKPEAICVETLSYDEEQRSFKLDNFNEFMISKGYQIYADTRVNTIFCREELFRK